MALERRGASKPQQSQNGSQSAPKKQTNKGNGKKDGSMSKAVGIIIGGVIILLIVLVCIATWKHRKTDTKPEDLMPKSAQNVGGVQGNTQGQPNQQQPQPQNQTNGKPAPNNNAYDQNKTQQASGTSPQNSTQQKFTAEQLGKMSKEERQKVLKDSVDNRQDTTPKAFLSNEQIANSKIKLGFTPENLAQRDDYANYIKHTSKTADHTFLLWLDLTYKGKKYYAIIDPNYWNSLDDTGIIPVSVNYFIDSSNSENILSVKPTESNS